MNIIEMNPERYIVAENSWDEWEEWFDEFLHSINEHTDRNLILWAKFRTNHVDEKCVWDKKTGNMFTIN